MSAIFISHSSTDAAVADEVRAWLVAEGHRSLFLDFDPEFGIPAGRDWEQELYQRLRACRAVIVLCSQRSTESHWCFAEVALARSLGKALLPVRIDGCRVDGLLSGQQVIDLGAGRVEAFERVRRGLLSAGVDPTDVFDWDPTRPPYPGLLAFEERDAGIFFGRTGEIDAGLDLLNRVRRLGSPGVAVLVGASGSGKSSLVRAGLLPRLRRDTARWLVVDPVRPRDDPVAELAAAWARVFSAVGEPRNHVEIAAELCASDSTVANPLVSLSNRLRRAANRSEAKVLLVVDQFEELLGAADDVEDVIKLLAGASEAASPLLVLVTLRSDFLGAFQTHQALLGLRSELMPVGPMSAADVAQIIEGPAALAGLQLESGLVSAMLADTDTDDALPLLAFTLRELYDHYGADGRLEVREYRDLGGLYGALARVADELVQSEQLAPDEEDQLRHALLAMVRLTDDDRWVRNVADWDQLPESIHPLLHKFVAARLLVAGGDPNARTIEVAHEALFRSWDRLAGWLRDDAEAMRLRRDLQHAASVWEAAGRLPADLWRGARLGRAAELDRRGDLSLDVVANAFIGASLDAEQAEIDQQERSRRRKLRVAAAVTAGALLLAATALVFFVRARSESDRAQREARQSAALALAAQARELAPENPALALVLAAEASRRTPTPLPQATTALFGARRELAHRRGQPVGEPFDADVSDIAFNADGRLLGAAVDVDAATGFADVTVRMWDPAGGESSGRVLDEGDPYIGPVDLSDDGRLLAYASNDGQMRLWDVDSGEQVGHTIQGPPVLAVGLAMSADGSLLAATGTDGTLWLGEPASGQLVEPSLAIDDGASAAVAFSPDGSLLASGGLDGTVRLSDPDSGQEVRPRFEGHVDRVLAVAFSPDGSMLASASFDGTVRLWDPDSGEPIGQPLEAESSSLTFSPDGKLLVSASLDGTMQLWDPVAGQQLGQPIEGHSRQVGAMAFSPDGKLLVSAGEDGTVRLWDPAAQEPLARLLEGQIETVGAVAFSPDGSMLAAAVGDDSGTVRLWDPANGEPIGEPLHGNDGYPQIVAFSPDGRVLASSAFDGTVRLWDPANGEPMGELIAGNDDMVWSVAFSPDGSMLAAAVGDDDGTVRLWDPASGESIGEPLAGHRGFVVEVAFSADGSLLASAGADGTVRLWSPATGEQVGEPLEDHEGGAFAVAFSPDGGLLATSDDAGTIRIWDPAGEPIGEALGGHPDHRVAALSFSADGSMLASAGADGTVRLWDPIALGAFGEPLEGHEDSVDVVAFSPVGDLLVTVSGGTVQLWNAPWDIDVACELATPYVTAAQVEARLPPGETLTACDVGRSQTSGE